MGFASDSDSCIKKKKKKNLSLKFILRVAYRTNSWTVWRIQGILAHIDWERMVVLVTKSASEAVVFP